MNALAGVAIVVILILAASAFFVRSAGRVILVAPVVIVVLGTLWLFGSLAYYQRTTGRDLNGLVGYHHSVPEWGFKYAPEGPRIERWAFHAPAITTSLLLVASAIAASARRARNLGLLRTVGLWVYHAGWASAFLLTYAVVWAEAASVFI